MKKVISVLGMVATITACNKTGLTPTPTKESTKETTDNMVIYAKQIQDPKNKQMDINACDKCPACIDGTGYCLEVVVTPKFTEAFKIAIDKNEVSSFLTNGIIQELGHGNGKIISELHLVRNGIKRIAYVNFPKDASKTGFIIGSNPNALNYDVAIVTSNQ